MSPCKHPWTSIVSRLTWPNFHLATFKRFIIPHSFTQQSPQNYCNTTAIYCTKYCALRGLNSFFVMCVARIKYSNTVINWSTLFETYIRGTLYPGHCWLLPSLAVFSYFLQLSSLQVPKVGPDSATMFMLERVN